MTRETVGSRLQGLTAVVTGGSRGIGAATAVRLAAEGASVMITYRSYKVGADAVVAEIAASGGSAWAVEVDVTRDDMIARLSERARDELGRIGVLVNNAGDMIRRETLENTTRSLARASFELNVVSLVEVTRQLLPYMGEGGMVINIASLAARNGGAPGSAMYAASKAAVVGLTMAWAKELGPRGIRVNAVAPGVIDTEFQRRHESAPGSMAAMTGSLPIPRPGHPDDVARIICCLAGEGRGFVTGTVVDVNGGGYLG